MVPYQKALAMAKPRPKEMEDQLDAQQSGQSARFSLPKDCIARSRGFRGQLRETVGRTQANAEVKDEVASQHLSPS